MALPPEIIRRTVTYGPETDFLGNPVTGTVVFTPSQDLTWTATGQGLHVNPITVTLDSTGSGSVSLICTDQTGFADASGNAVTNWTYTRTAQLRLGSSSSASPVPVPSPPAVAFQVPQGTGSLDLDTMIPVVGSGAVTVLVPAITSFAGLPGPTITAQQVADLVGPIVLAARPIRTVTANSTLAVSDTDGTIVVNSATTRTVTVPADSTANLAAGTQVWVVNIGTAAATVIDGTGGGTTTFATLAQYETARLLKVAANTWVRA